MGVTAMHHSMQHKIVPTTIPHKLEYFLKLSFGLSTWLWVLIH